MLKRRWNCLHYLDVVLVLASASCPAALGLSMSESKSGGAGTRSKCGFLSPSSYLTEQVLNICLFTTSNSIG